MSDEKVKIFERALQRERKARKQAEEILEQKSLELFEANQKLTASNKKTEALLNDQTAQLKLIVDNSSLGIVLSQKNNLIKFNKAFANLLGYTDDELLNVNIYELSHPDDLPQAKKQLKLLEESKIDKFLIKKRYRKKDGNYVSCNTNVSAVRDNEGNVKYHIALIEDVSEIDKKTRMLNALNSLSVSILGKRDLNEIAWEIAKNTANHLDLEDCLVFSIDYESNIIKEIAAYSNNPDIDITKKPPLHIPIGKGVIGKVVETGVYSLVNDTSKNDLYEVDDFFRFSELTVPIIADNKVIGIIDSEHSKKNYFNNDHIEVFHNIASLASAQFNSAISLIKEKKTQKEKDVLLVQLGKNNEELKNFAHVVSHDLKSPLRSMSALISWIQEDNEGTFDEETTVNFNSLLKKIDKMDHLINGILKYSSIDKIDKTDQKVDLQKTVTDIIDTIFVPEHINIQIKNTLPIIYGDKFRLQQLFQNLISNAIKYNDKEKGIITIEVEDLDNKFLFIIKDNGIGIDKKYHSKIFEVFETLEEPNDDSTGIGLSIVKKIIDLYNGKIWLESELGKGCSFFFELKKPH
ncbi:ATP-binding protein [Tenacibaculum halocynthiae]|uniref:ATP-binding protein n=1 Tax=Tenacibaculum halocynthiae TaxID=1254437 RepID=UPI0038960F57